MLILSRKKEESFIINDSITVKIIDIGGERVKIGITAPKSVKIIRSELQQTIEVNKEARDFVKSPADLAVLLKKAQAKNNDNSV